MKNQELIDALEWALRQIEDDLDPDHQAALAEARAALDDAKQSSTEAAAAPHHKTNVELVMDMMQFSKAGGLKEAFVIAAINAYAEAQLAAPTWDKKIMLSQAAWKQCAHECLDAINNRINNGS